MKLNQLVKAKIWSIVIPLVFPFPIVIISEFFPSEKMFPRAVSKNTFSLRSLLPHGNDQQ